MKTKKADWKKDMKAVYDENLQRTVYVHKNPSAHTPGPWEVTESGDQLEIMQVDGKSIAVVLDEPEAMANARLIAAAPELLAIAKILATQFEASPNKGQVYVGYELIEMARKAVAKAK